ncbi:MAG: undecaprenyl/decaprenyl-phosphate alpha-N-acetylglucosaminyl 1-phosphate transferase [Alphaproteobacteria bacterium]|nr:undecaprenyl/decaprenyl-phosphate alpha-N-acetylglucosaminyl 1-phosphate transferase [Alphaproteobacteria bacterium]
MYFQFLSLIAVLVTLLVCLNAESLGRLFGVMAVPDGRRRTHDTATPQVGGVAILCGFAVWLMGSLWPERIHDPILGAVLLSAVGLGLVGFVDDRHEVPPVLRILLLLIFVAIAFALDPTLIAQKLHWYSFGDLTISNWFYVLLMAITAIGLVNSVNMADGQNGLVGSMFVTWTACLAMLTNGPLAMTSGILCATCMVFLFFNLRGKIFLGDCGSYGVTFAIGLLVTLAHARGALPLETVVVWFFIPVIDCLRLIIARPLRGRSLFQGGRDHFHHRLTDSLGRRLSAVVYIGAVSASSLVATLAPQFSLVCLCALTGFYFSFAHLSDTDVGQEGEGKRPVDHSNKVIPLAGDHGRKR